MADGVHEGDRADDDQPEGDEHLDVDDPQARAVARRHGPPGIEPVEAQRREVLDVDGRVGLEMGLDVPAVDDEQDDRDEDLRPGRVAGQEQRGGDREPVGHDERADVLAEDLRVDRHDVAFGPAARLPHDREAGDEHREGREHERRAEDRPDADLVRVLAGR